MFGEFPGFLRTFSPVSPLARNRDQNDQRIHAMVDSIPAGRVATYGQVAREAGLPGRARLVGRALRNLPEGSTLPWHRVLNASGKISLSPGSTGCRAQRRLLESEGVQFDPRGRIDLRRFGWQPEWDGAGDRTS